MTGNSPSIYLLTGNNEFAIRSFLEEQLKPKMGDSVNAAMDITTLDGTIQNLDALQAETQTIPFLSKRRMVILHNPLALTRSKANQEKFKNLLDSVPPTTALVLIEDRILDKGHWLMRWIQSNNKRSWSQVFSLPKGAAVNRWIQDQADQLGGKIDHEAAQLLASYLDEDPRLANMEIQKLLTYVDLSRPITETDVRNLTPDVRDGDVFAMVDAIGYGDGERAMFMLRRLLEDSDPLPLFGMIVRQFRLLIQIRELLDEKPQLNPNQMAEIMGLSSSYPVKKILPQAKLFTLIQLKNIFHQLSEVDQAMKTSRLDNKLALDLLIASLTL